ncbi:hypothetical protein MAR_005855 [Mya arenaria]|uniref:Uncharacterized protein n=1 Tax=Mya arenaria TaxID=6604 RepID=A0ABY7F0P9_MYAAR|nr:hypothetical protein MAR_005855 [Mya arenaria]
MFGSLLNIFLEFAITVAHIGVLSDVCVIHSTTVMLIKCMVSAFLYPRTFIVYYIKVDVRSRRCNVLFLMFWKCSLLVGRSGGNTRRDALWIRPITYCVISAIRVVDRTLSVENHSDTSSDNGVLHIATEGVQYAIVQRQAATQRIETQNPQDDECLTYAELDVKFLQAANARVPSRKMNTPTEYADIEFFSTQGPAVEHPGYHYASV